MSSYPADCSSIRCAPPNRRKGKSRCKSFYAPTRPSGSKRQRTPIACRLRKGACTRCRGNADGMDSSRRACAERAEPLLVCVGSALERFQNGLGSAVEILALANQQADRPREVALRKGLG